MKRQFGAWILPAMSVLRRFRFLRGSGLDPFGRTLERRLERRMIIDYRQRIETLTQALTPENLPQAIAIAGLPDAIRGFGPVKLEAIRQAGEKLAKLGFPQ